MRILLRVGWLAIMAALPFPCAGAEEAAAPEDRARAWEQAYYLEQGAGDIGAAAKMYERLAGDEQAPPAWQESARLRLAYCRLSLEETEAGVSLLEALLESRDSAVAEAAAAKLLSLAEAARAAGGETRARAFLDPLKRKAPGALAQWEKTRDAIRVALRGLLETWDGREALPVHLRIEGRAPDVERTPRAPVERPLWHASVDPTGRFECALPPGEFELVVSTPIYERRRQRFTLLPEMTDGLDLRVTLGRIQLPEDVHQVHLLGDWLKDWTETLPMIRGGDGTWEITQHLPAGEHHYKFMVGHYRRWLCDVRGAEFADDERGGFNTVLRLDQERDVVFRFDERDPHFVERPQR